MSRTKGGITIEIPAWQWNCARCLIGAVSIVTALFTVVGIIQSAIMFVPQFVWDVVGHSSTALLLGLWAMFMMSLYVFAELTWRSIDHLLCKEFLFMGDPHVSLKLIFRKSR